MNRLKEKFALITGASSGIGESCSFKLAEMGVNLVLASRNSKKLTDLKCRIEENFKVRVIVIELDVRKKSDVNSRLTSLLENINLDILINNAGLALGVEKIYDGLSENWEQMIDTNVKGLLYVSRVIIPHMKSRNHGHIVNIGSIAGRTAYPGGNVYCATKAAVHMLNSAMNVDLMGTNIRVSNVAPGAVKTNFSNIRFKGDLEKSEAVYNGYEPLTADDISDLILYILNAPEHVNIQDTLIMPTAQRNPYLVHKE